MYVTARSLDWIIFRLDYGRVVRKIQFSLASVVVVVVDKVLDSTIKFFLYQIFLVSTFSCIIIACRLYASIAIFYGKKVPKWALKNEAVLKDSSKFKQLIIKKKKASYLNS